MMATPTKQQVKFLERLLWKLEAWQQGIMNKELRTDIGYPKLALMEILDKMEDLRK